MIDEDNIRYKIVLELEDSEHGRKTVIAEQVLAEASDGRANWEWCFGCGIGEALRGLDGRMSHEGLMDVFSAIGAIGDDHHLRWEKITAEVAESPHPKGEQGHKHGKEAASDDAKNSIAGEAGKDVLH